MAYSWAESRRQNTLPTYIGEGGLDPYAFAETDKEPPLLGKSSFSNMLINMLMNNPQYAQLWEQLQQGLDPRTRQALQGLTQQREGLLGGGEFGQGEADVFRNLISGQTLGEEGGVLRRMIQEQMAPQREAMRGLLASRGMGPGTGSYGGAVGTLAGEQAKGLQDVMVQRYLDMVRTGTSGLGTMEAGELGRQQLAGQLGMFGAQLPEQARQFGLQYGLGLTQAEQAPLMNLLGMSQGEWLRAKQSPSTWETLLGAGAQVAPWAISAATGGAAGAVGGGMFGKYASNVKNIFEENKGALAGF